MNQDVKRGEIHYVKENNLSPPIGTEMWANRPALIVSNDTCNLTSGFVSIVYLTTQMNKKASPTHVSLISGGKPALALCEQIHTVDKSRLQGLLGTITKKEQKLIDMALACSIGLHSNEINYIGLFKKWEIHLKNNTSNTTKEQIKLEEINESDTIKILKHQIEIITNEKDGYQLLLKARNEMLKNLVKKDNTPPQGQIDMFEILKLDDLFEQ